MWKLPMKLKIVIHYLKRFEHDANSIFFTQIWQRTL